MAQIPNTSAFSEGDGRNTYINIDTVNKLLQVMNGAAIKLYSDAGVTLTAQIVGGGVAPAQSATAVAVANAGTIATANIGVSRVAPTSAVTGIILAAGTIPGQLLWVVNEAAAVNSVTFAASAPVDQFQCGRGLQRGNAAGDGSMVDAERTRRRGQRALAGQHHEMAQIVPVEHCAKSHKRNASLGSFAYPATLP